MAIWIIWYLSGVFVIAHLDGGLDEVNVADSLLQTELDVESLAEGEAVPHLDV